MVGTAAGTLVAVVTFAALRRGGWEVPVVLLPGAMLPLLRARDYGFRTAGIAPLTLLLSDISNLVGAERAGRLMADSLIGRGIAFPAGVRPVDQGRRRVSSDRTVAGTTRTYSPGGSLVIRRTGRLPDAEVDPVRAGWTGKQA
ncbi:hypothetical protein [Streptomyces sp. NPDC057939]|uniref:hypothetical protein n=1 Tax=Streptomyces sp. NPDC057939 TaxID=3346284 RepID=UPI0036E4BE13